MPHTFLEWVFAIAGGLVLLFVICGMIDEYLRDKYGSN